MFKPKVINVEDIEYQYTLDFLPEIKNKYYNDIITIFNGDLETLEHKYSNIKLNDPEINIILAIYYNCNKNIEHAINILNINSDYPRSLCTLGVLYKQYDESKTIECLEKAYNMGEQNAINNLAYQYYLINDIDNFNKYNNLLVDDKKYINLALVELYVKNNYNIGLEYIIKACGYNSYRAYYIYAMDFLLKNGVNDEFYKTLFNGFKIKPVKKNIDYLIKNTTPEFRFILCYKYDYPVELFSKYDSSVSPDIIKCQIIKNKVCPVCLIKKEFNIKLSCYHSFCESCFVEHKKCILCN
jgi:hypothetical protein